MENTGRFVSPEATLLLRIGVPAARVRRTTVAGRVPAGTRPTTCGAAPATPRGAAATTGPAIPIPPRCCASATTGRTSKKLPIIQIRRMCTFPGTRAGTLGPLYSPCLLQLRIQPTLKGCAHWPIGFKLGGRHANGALLLALVPSTRYSLRGRHCPTGPLFPC